MITKQHKLLTGIQKKMYGMPGGKLIHRLLHEQRNIVSLKGANEEVADFKFHKVLDGYELKPIVTKEFAELCTPELKPSYISEPTPDRGVYAINDAELYTDCVYDVLVFGKKGDILQEVSFMHSKLYAKKQEQTHYITHFTKPKKHDWVVFPLLVGGGGQNYFHWLIDALPRVYMLKKSGLFDTVDKFLVADHSKPFQKETLKLLGIEESKIITSYEYNHIITKQLILANNPRAKTFIAPWIFDFIEESFVRPVIAEDQDQEPIAERIYISRGDANQRRVDNEEEVIGILKKHGFTIVQLAGLPFRKQVKYFNQAKIIIAPHGANMANLVFCNREAKVFEFFSEPYVMPLYNEISLRMGLAYHYQVYPDPNLPIDKKRPSLRVAQAGDIYVNIEAFKQKLAEMNID